MRYLLFIFSLFLSYDTTAAPLTTSQVYGAQHTDFFRNGVPGMIMAKGLNDNNAYMLEVDPVTGAIPVSGSFALTYDTNYGTVGANTLRSAAQIGNATGAALFGAGTTTSQVLRVVLPTDQSAIPASQSGTWNINNISGTVSLPTGASTAANQATGNASLSSIDGKMASLGQKVMTGSMPVVVASDQSAIPSSQSGTWNINNISGTVSLPTGASTAANQTTANSSLSSIDGKMASLGQKVMTGSMPVVIASDQSAITVTAAAPAGRAKVVQIRNDYSGVNVTTAAYVQILASTSGTINKLWVFDSSGSALVFAVGGVGSEVDQFYISPGGLATPMELAIPASSRLSIKAVDTTASTGQLLISAMN